MEEMDTLSKKSLYCQSFQNMRLVFDVIYVTNILFENVFATTLKYMLDYQTILIRTVMLCLYGHSHVDVPIVNTGGVEGGASAITRAGALCRLSLVRTNTYEVDVQG